MPEELEIENQTLRERLHAAEEILRAIRAHEVDAVVVGPGDQKRVFTLGGVDEGYRTFVESMRQGAVTVAREGTILYANRYFAEMMEVPVENIVGSSIFDFATPENDAALRALIWGACTTEELHRNFSFRSLGGALVPAELMGTPLPVDGHIHICLLVTDLREREARLAAEGANSAKDRFLALLSHELRTPLTPAMLVVSEMELDEKLPAQVRESLGIVRRGLELETRLIDDLLDLSRVVSGRLSLRTQPMNLHSVFQNVLATVTPDAQEKRLRIELDLAAPASMVAGDAARLQQVFWNLLKNAVKFSKPGGRIAIRSSAEDGYIAVTVEDEGEGIDPEVLPRIFEAFEQGHSRGDRGGLGLGLAIAKGLVEAHGGSISAHSDGPGMGASLRVRLPVVPHDSLHRMDEARQESGGQPSVRVLLVEDHADTAKALSRLLRQAGHTVEHAESIAAGLEKAKAGAFDLVISDIGLPDGSGHELMQRLQAEYGLQGIALTGYGADGNLKASSAAGFAAHIVKPIDAGQLHEAIGRVIAMRKPRVSH